MTKHKHISSFTYQNLDFEGRMEYRKRKRALSKISKVFRIFVIFAAVAFVGAVLYTLNTTKTIQIEPILTPPGTSNGYIIDPLATAHHASGTYRSKYRYVYDITHRKEVINDDADVACAPASLVKLMTIYTALQHIQSLDQVAPIDKETFQHLLDENASMAGFVADEQTTYKDLLYGTLLRSGGECATNLAIHTAGSVDAFVKEMNDNARKLGLSATHYTNPTGLDDPNQISCAADVVKVFNACLQDKRFKEILTAQEYTSSKTNQHPKGITMKNNILSHITPEEQNGFKIFGGKSGTTDNAGLCWVTLVTKNNVDYIVCVMGVAFQDINDPGHGQKDDTIQLINELP